MKNEKTMDAGLKKPEKVAVIGGTGRAGKYLVKELIRQGYSIKMLARDPAKITLRSPLIEVVTGNARDYSAINQLLAGCDAVISALGPSKSEPDTCSITVGNILRVMQEKKINRYLEVAGLGIDAAEDHKGLQTRLVVSIIKFFFPAVVNDRQKVYKLLSDSQINWTIVRCPMIEQTDLKRTMKISLNDSPGRKVSATDLASFLIDQLSGSQYVGKCPFVAS